MNQQQLNDSKDLKIKELKNQILKMRNCANCANLSFCADIENELLCQTLNYDNWKPKK